MQKERCFKGCLKENKRAVNKIKCHPELDSGSHLVSVLESGEIPNHCNQTPDKDLPGRGQAVKAAVWNDSINNNAFTLIELLVVVLIIGILAAVALPQYQKAVEKSRFATYRTLAHSLATSAETAYLANGSWPTSLDELSVDLPADMSTQNDISNGVCRKNNKIFCCISFPDANAGWGGSVRCGDNEYHMIYSRGYADTNGDPLKRMSCSAKDEKYKAVCKAISGGKNGASTSVITPEGSKAGFFYYTID